MSWNSINVVLPSPLQPFRLSHWPKHSPQVWIKRDDLIHPIISGNKWRKLKYVPLDNIQHVVSIGGGYSNHLHALGFLCASQGIAFTALIRGNYQSSPTPMINDLERWLCHIHYLSKKDYEQRESKAFSAWLTHAFPGSFYIPEGGSTEHGLKGVKEVYEEIISQSIHPNFIFAPVASGATLAGLIQSVSAHAHVMGVAVLKGKGYLESQVQRFLTQSETHWSINHEHCFNGYGKSDAKLTAFIQQVYEQTSVSLEPVYSGKLFYCLDHMIMKNTFSQNDVLVALHTGGLQGARSSQSK